MGRFAVGACQDFPADVGEFGSVQVLEVVPVRSERGSVGPRQAGSRTMTRGPAWRREGIERLTARLPATRQEVVRVFLSVGRKRDVSGQF